MKKTIIIANSILMPDDRMLRLGVVKTDEQVLTYEAHYAEIYARMYAFLEEAYKEDDKLVSRVEDILGETFYGVDGEMADFTEFILSSDPMLYFLSDLRKNWQQLSESEIMEMNAASSTEAVQMDGVNQGNQALAKEYLKEYNLFMFLESLSMYLDT